MVSPQLAADMLRSMATITVAFVAVTGVRIWLRGPTQATQMTRPGVTKKLSKLEAFLFDVFEFVEECKPSEALLVAGRHIFSFHGFMTEFNIDQTKLDNFLRKTHAGMTKNKNDYHNELHVTDVLQSVHSIIVNSSLSTMLSVEEKFAVIVAAIIHDLEHRGLSNEFLTESNDSWQHEAGPDASPNEYHHATAGIALLNSEECCILPIEGRTRLLIQIKDLVLATDMSQHNNILKEMNAANNCESANRAMLLKGLLKVSDLGHSFAPWDTHRRWAKRVEEEFWKEGDLRRESGMSSTIDMMDRSLQDKSATATQDGFFAYVVIPLINSWCHLFPECKSILEQAERNRSTWPSPKSHEIEI